MTNMTEVPQQAYSIMSKYKSQGNLGKKTTKRVNPLVQGLHNDSPIKKKRCVIVSESSESEVALAVFGDVSKKTCRIYLMITPYCCLTYPQVKAKLQELNAKYDKKMVLGMIEHNMVRYGIGNIHNLQVIEDDEFWSFIMPKLVELLHFHLPKMDMTKLLLRNFSQIVDIRRVDVLMILASMFIGIMPNQPHQKCTSLGQLMMFRQGGFSRELVRRQKLKCIISYFKTTVKNHKIYNQQIRIKRTSSEQSSYLDTSNFNNNVPLHPVTVKQESNIQDYLGGAIMVDFANKKIGRGVLKDQCKREQIMFCTFPQLIITKLMCEQLQDNQAIVIYGARRYVKHSGYGEKFQFVKEAPLQKISLVNKSAIVAIDAAEYSSISNKNIQFTKKEIRREIHKAFVGMEGAISQDNQDMPICTGKWGFESGSDEDLKFLIQWIASSEARREMIYLTSNQQKAKQYSMLVHELCQLTTLDLLSLLDQYAELRERSNCKNVTLFQYIKYSI